MAKSNNIFRSRSHQNINIPSSQSQQQSSNSIPKMCGCCCGGSGGQFCPPLLGSILGVGCQNQNNRRITRQMSKWWSQKRTSGVVDGGQVAALLTPYELEQLPLMLRELDGANRHFWQMVCWRMENRMRKESSKEEGEGMAKAKVKRKSSKDQQKQQQLMSVNNGIEMLETVAQRRAKGIDDSYADGCALRELIRMLAKTLCEKGAFDEDAEQMLSDYRLRLLGEECGGGGGTQQQPKMGQMRGSPGPRGLAERRREFAQKGRAISFNGALDKALAADRQNNNSEKQNSSSGSSSTSSGYSSEANHPNNQTNVGAGRRAACWLRQRANSVRSRSTRRCACQAQQRIGQLGELLCAEFHSTVYAHPEQFDVHERELKVLVWRRFVHLLVALLIERNTPRGDKKAERH